MDSETYIRNLQRLIDMEVGPRLFSGDIAPQPTRDPALRKAALEALCAMEALDAAIEETLVAQAEDILDWVKKGEHASAVDRMVKAMEALREALAT